MIKKCIPHFTVTIRIFNPIKEVSHPLITIDYQSRAPIYEQIVEKFQMLILKGVLSPGSRMPSVRSLAVELSINPNTIQKAFAVLEQEGYIFPVKGRGNFVSESASLFQKKKESCLDELKKLLSYAAELGVPKKDCTEILSQVYEEVF